MEKVPDIDQEEGAHAALEVQPPPADYFPALPGYESLSLTGWCRLQDAQQTPSTTNTPTTNSSMDIEVLVQPPPRKDLSGRSKPRSDIPA